MVQTPILDEQFQFSNTWKNWQEYFREWVSLVSTMIYDVDLSKKASPELSILKSKSMASTPLDYVSKETDFSLVVRARKWKEEGNHERIVNSIKNTENALYLNWILIDAYLELEEQEKAAEILESIKDKSTTPLDTARWNYYYGRMLYLSEKDDRAVYYMDKAEKQSEKNKHYQLYQEVKEWMSKPVKRFLNFEFA